MSVAGQCQPAVRCNQTVFLLHDRVYSRRQKCQITQMRCL